jgi:hypothetical protein
MIWDVEPSYRELIVRGEEFLSFPNHRLVFGPVTSCTHDLGRAGWQLRMIQRTPVHVPKTRPKLYIHPPDAPNNGFKFKLRACRPYLSPAEVFYDVGAYGLDYVEMSLAKYETREVVREKIVEVPVYKYVDETLRVPPQPVDPFQALRAWNDERVAAMEFPSRPAEATPEPVPPDNVVDFLEALRRRETVDIDPLLKERIKEALA